MDFPLLLHGPHGSGKTARLLEAACSFASESGIGSEANRRMVTVLTAGRIASWQAAEIVEARLGSELLGFNVLSYWELLFRVSGRAKGDMYALLDLEVVRHAVCRMLGETSSLVIFDQIELLKERMPLILECLPQGCKWGASFSYPRKDIPGIVEALSKFGGAGVSECEVVRSDRELSVISFSSTKEILIPLEAWLRRISSEKGDLQPGTWHAIIQLDWSIGRELLPGLLQAIKKIALNEGIQAWVSYDQRAPLGAPDLAVVLSREAYGVRCQNGLLLKYVGARDANPADQPSSDREVASLTWDKIRTLSRRDLESLECFLEGKPAYINEVFLEGPPQDWWIEVRSGSGFRRVTPESLRILVKKS